jgi:hypothetical protein
LGRGVPHGEEMGAQAGDTRVIPSRATLAL